MKVDCRGRLLQWSLLYAGRVLADRRHDNGNLQLASDHQPAQSTGLCLRMHVYDQHNLLPEDPVAGWYSLYDVAFGSDPLLAHKLGHPPNRCNGPSGCLMGCGRLHGLFVRHISQVICVLHCVHSFICVLQFAFIESIHSFVFFIELIHSFVYFILHCLILL